MDQEFTIAIHQAPARERTPEGPNRRDRAEKAHDDDPQNGAPAARGIDPRHRAPEPTSAPVLGWLVCIEGPARGLDLPITRNRFTVADPCAAHEAQAPSPILTRDAATGAWTIQENGDRRALAAYDPIRLPGSTLLFLPYEGAP